MRTADRAWYAAVRDASAAALIRGIGGRWELPGGGLLAIERPLPFLVIAPADHADGAAALSGGLASRLIVPADPRQAPGVDAIAHGLVEALATRSSALGVIWLASPAYDGGAPIVTVRLGPDPRWDELAPALAGAFARLALDPERPASEATAPEGDRAGVRVLRELPRSGRLTIAPSLAPRVCEIEIEIPAVYRDARAGVLYPLLAEEVRRRVAEAVAHTANAFADRFLTRVRPRPRLGTSALDPAAREADRILCDADDAFEVLIQLTPADLEGTWRRLVATHFEEEPALRYRPLPFDPMLVKRRVFEAPVEAVEDPFVAELLREKQEELDRLLSMLRDRGETFLHESEQLYGRPTKRLVQLAERVLAAPNARAAPEEEPLALDTVLALTRVHMHRYREQDPLFPEEIELRTDTAASLMVVHGRLILRPDVALGAARLDALLEHEVGTHVLTWFNGSAQPLRILGRGLAGYEPLQEGLAVLAEHLAGCLDPARLRVLAARVIAADAVAAGASFLEVFHGLCRDRGLRPRAAFQTTVRALRGGGLTKDLVYLRGLCDLMAYLRDGGSLPPLYTGKLALRHVPVIGMLEERGLLVAPRVLPEVLRRESAEARLASIREAEDPLETVAAMAGAEREGRAA